jgi:CBS domain containing-hemolysin-like protein
VQGVVTPADMFEAIAGRFPHRGQRDEVPECTDEPDGSLRVEASVDMRRLGQALDIDLVREEDRFATLAAFLLKRFGRVPAPGAVQNVDGVRFEVVEADARRIGVVRVTRMAPEPAET